MKDKSMTTSSILRQSNLRIGLSWSPNSSMTPIPLTSIFSCQQVTQSSINICLANCSEVRRMSCSPEKLVWENQSLLEISLVQLTPRPMSILSWTSLPKPAPKTCWTCSWTRINSRRREELRSVHWEARRWSFTWTISTCQLSRNTVLNLPTNCSGKSSIRKGSMIWRSSCSWKCPMSSSLLLAHLREVVETQSPLDCLGTLTCFGHLIYHIGPWTSFSLPYWKGS